VTLAQAAPLTVGPLQGSRSGERGRAELATRRGSYADPAPGDRQGGTNASGTAEHDMLIRGVAPTARQLLADLSQEKKIRWVGRDHPESPIPCRGRTSTILAGRSSPTLWRPASRSISPGAGWSPAGPCRVT